MFFSFARFRICSPAEKYLRENFFARCLAIVDFPVPGLPDIVMSIFSLFYYMIERIFKSYCFLSIKL